MTNNNPDILEIINQLLNGKSNQLLEPRLADFIEYIKKQLLSKQEAASGLAAGKDINVGSISQKQNITYKINPVINILDGNTLIQNHESVDKEFVESFCKAYHATIPYFPEDWVLHRPQANNPDDILKQIFEIAIHKREIWDKFCNNLYKQISNSQNTQEYQVQPNSYLLIELSPDFNRGNKELFLKAWFIPDDIITDTEERFKPLAVDEQQAKILFIEEELPLLLGKLIDQCYEKSRIKQLTIEIFLPRAHLCDEVEKWSYQNSEGINIIIGKFHRVVVRSYDRLKQLRLRKPEGSYWLTNWEKVKLTWNDIPCIEQVTTVSQACFDPNNLTNLLVEKIVLKVCCKLSNSEQNNLLAAIHSAGTPIVIWSRCELGSLRNSEDFDVLLEKPLQNLSACVREQRLAADDEMHLGNHLVLLWDDPNRVPPDHPLEFSAS